jgi:hypothetical protein
MNRPWCKLVKTAPALNDKRLATAFYTNPVENISARRARFLLQLVEIF